MGRAAEAFAEHCRAWNDGDRTRWLALFADDVVLEDPVGGLPKSGRAALQRSWKRSHQPGRHWTLMCRQAIECGDEVAVVLENHGVVDGESVTVVSIEIWRVNGDGHVCSVRSFFEPDPDVHDPWYLPTTGLEEPGVRPG